MKPSFAGISFWYALRRIRRKPIRFLSMTAIVCALLVSLFLLLLFMEAEWRADVMPDHEENYHFYFYTLKEDEKAYIAAQPWVQATYDIYRDIAPETPAYYENQFRVRVTWDHVLDAGKYARETMSELGLFSRLPYRTMYESCYQIGLDKFRSYWYGAESVHGMTAETFAAIQGEREVVEAQVMYAPFYNKTSNTYILQPKFFSLILLFGGFLVGAFTVLLSEDYRRSLKEYGCLRAQGFRISHIFLINMTETLLIQIAAIPLSALLTALILRFWRAAAVPASDSVFFTVADSVPVALMAAVSGILVLASLAGTFLVCFLYRNTPIMSYLREQGTFTVSFVSKTSDAFERAEGVGIYNRLYLYRARKTVIWNTAVTALMMPLPFYMLKKFTETFADSGSPEGYAAFLYTLLETAAILITALCVTVISSRSASAARSAEFGVFRALGADRNRIRRIAYPTATLQALLLLVLALVLVAFYDAAGASVYSVGVKEPKGFLVLFSELFSKAAAVALFVFPSAYGGLLLFLHGFFRNSIISSIREQE